MIKQEQTKIFEKYEENKIKFKNVYKNFTFGNLFYYTQLENVSKELYSNCRNKETYYYHYISKDGEYFYNHNDNLTELIRQLTEHIIIDDSKVCQGLHIKEIITNDNLMFCFNKYHKLKPKSNFEGALLNGERTYFTQLKPHLILFDINKRMKDNALVPFIDDDIIQFINKHKYFITIYKISIDRMSYNQSKKTIVQNIINSRKKLKFIENAFENNITETPKYTDDELINIFDEKIENIKICKTKQNTQKTNESLTNNIENEENINDNSSCDSIEHEQIINDSFIDNKISYNITFNKKIKFDDNEKEFIHFLIKNLYNTKEKFKLLVDKYKMLCVTKPIHKDNFSYYKHFTAYFYNNVEKIKGDKLHFYIKENEIINITKIESIL